MYYSPQMKNIPIHSKEKGCVIPKVAKASSDPGKAAG